jgi:hypothetical protein
VEEIRTAFLKKAHRVTQFCCAHQPGWPWNLNPGSPKEIER